MSLIIIAEPNATSAERLLEAAAEAGGVELSRTNCLDDVPGLIEERDVSVLVIGPSLVDESAFRLADGLLNESATSTVVVASSVDATMLRQALRAGVSDVLALDDPLADVTHAIARAHDASEARRRATRAAGQASGGASGRVVTVFAAKGGVGKTAVATNLAVALAKEAGEGRVALVDLDLEFGDVAIVLGMRPRRTIYDVVQVFDRIDGEMLEGFLEAHGSGVHVLIAPTRPEEAEEIAAAHVGQVIDLLRSRFSYVVIDTCPSFSEGVLAALDRSDEVYLVASTDVTAVKNARVAVQKLRQLDYDIDRVRLVLNRADHRLNLPTKEVEEAIGLRVESRVPADIAVPRSQNKGVSVISDAPRCDVTKSIVALAKATATRAKESGTHVVA